MSSRHFTQQIAALLLVLSISACARPVGDFGRAEPDPLHDAPTSAALSIRAIITPASRFNLTDQEVEMRDRVWRYLVSPGDYDWLGDSLAELERIGFGSPRFHPVPLERYYLWLHGTAFVSSVARYARLSDDIRADLGTMPAVFRSICAVEGVDRQRAIAVSGVPEIEGTMRDGVDGAHAENLAVIGWFIQSTAARLRSYGYALDHLLVETPHDQAMTVDSDLTQLETYVEAAKIDDFCSSQPRLSGHPRSENTGSRYERSQAMATGS